MTNTENMKKNTNDQVPVTSRDLYPFVTRKPGSLTTMELPEADWTSIYIPCITNNLRLVQNDGEALHFYPKYLKGFLEQTLCIGKVKRIDFVDRFPEKSRVPVKGAFVHFECWYDTDMAHYIRNSMNDGNGRMKLSEYTIETTTDAMCAGRFVRYRHSSDDMPIGFMEFRINYKPISDVEMDVNVHQVCAENQKLKLIVADRDEEIVKLRKLLARYDMIIALEDINVEEEELNIVHL